MQAHELFMHRCLQLAALGEGEVAPNPMVGAVLVYDSIIIGEGYHRKFGGPHAEVECIASVAESDQRFIPLSTLYVCLEPCNHHGKTPACSDLLIRHKIPKIVVACLDSFAKVNGGGIAALRDSGVEVTVGVLQNEARDLNRRFFTFHEKHRPYIVLKWAVSADGFIARKDFEQVQISNNSVNRMVHRWRSEEAAIMVGYNTALHDNPSLTTRLWTGRNPVRITVDELRTLPSSHNIFSANVETIVFNDEHESREGNVRYVTLPGARDSVSGICASLYENQIQSVLVEGGSKLLQKFIDADIWDEARIICNEDLFLVQGLEAPRLGVAKVIHTEKVESNSIIHYGRAK